jgi:hypothetical protein
MLELLNYMIINMSYACRSQDLGATGITRSLRLLFCDSYAPG